MRKSSCENLHTTTVLGNRDGSTRSGTSQRDVSSIHGSFFSLSISIFSRRLGNLSMEICRSTASGVTQKIAFQATGHISPRVVHFNNLLISSLGFAHWGPYDEPPLHLQLLVSLAIPFSRVALEQVVFECAHWQIRSICFTSCGAIDLFQNYQGENTESIQGLSNSETEKEKYLIQDLTSKYMCGASNKRSTRVMQRLQQSLDDYRPQ